MPYEFDKSKRAYLSADGYVKRAETRAVLDKLLEHFRNDAGKLAVRVSRGELTADQFEQSMRELLEHSHIIAGTVGKGGREQMRSSDWERINNKVEWQAGYLGKFARRVAKGTLSEAAIKSRAKTYSSGVYVSYADSVAESYREWREAGNAPQEDEVRLVQSSKEGCNECTADAAAGWMPISEMGEIGSRECGDWCLCEIEWKSDVEEGL